MIVDASPQCHKVSFDIGSGATNREWDIKVTQYDCAESFGGPDGCLQYFTGTSGRVSSFNFPTTASVITGDVTHLSNQMYSMCFRQERGYCSICFIPAISIDATDTIAMQSSFGLSVSAAPTTAVTNLNCNQDYLEIPHATDGVTTATIPAASAYRLCGRLFNTIETIATTTNSVCSNYHI